ncbi:MAG TPA: PA14 domain-containing protein [Chitinophagaceae bacterium]|nr:PA14 domain-containing protein [Chitinophagaceae bacterium]
MRKSFPILILFCSVYPAVTNAQVNVVTQHNDLSRTGANVNEKILNTDNVIAYGFGKLFEYAVNGHVYAQPLYVSGLGMPGRGAKNVLFVATMHNEVYAFDADDSLSPSNLLWHTNLGPSVPLPDPNIGKACGSYNDIQIEIGILSTPFIDLTSNTMYLVAKTKEGGQYIDRIHALDITTGSEKNGSPKIILGSTAGNGVGGNNGVISFISVYENQRSSLVMSNGIVYVCYAGYCDTPPYHGWMFGYNATDLSQQIVFNTTPNGDEGGIWMSGQGPAVDPAGDLYVVTGNGAFDPTARNFGDCVLRLRPNGNTLDVIDYFSPFNQQQLDQDDLDLGSDGVLLIPGTSLTTCSGKEGVLYLLDKNNLGGFDSTKNNCVQSFKSFNGHLHGSTVFRADQTGTGITYWWSEYDRLKAFRLINNSYDQLPALLGPQAPNQGMPGAMLSISSNGNVPGSAVLWASIPAQGDANHSLVNGMLRAFDATDLSNELWNSEQLTTRDRLGKFAKFCSPTIANGKVFVPTFSNKVVVYGVIDQGKLREPENPVGTVNGLDYDYYEGDWNYLPDFSQMLPLKSGNLDYLSLSPALKQDYFAMKYTGFIDIPVDGYYTFYLNSDDGSKFYIGDINIINNDGLHAASEASGRIGLKAGKHVFTITFFEKTGDQVLNLSYQGPGINKQLLPASRFYRVSISPYEIKLYPNPTHEKLNLFCGKSIKIGTDIFIYNSLGQMVIKAEVTGSISEINTSKLSPGVYQTHLVIDGQKITRSFIKSVK